MTDRAPTEAQLHAALAAATEAVSASLGMTLGATTPAPRPLEPADGIALQVASPEGASVVLVGEHAVAEALEQAMFDPVGALGPLVVETAGALGISVPDGAAERMALPDDVPSESTNAMMTLDGTDIGLIALWTEGATSLAAASGASPEAVAQAEATEEFLGPLADVDLDIAVEIGSTSVPIAELLQMGEGSVLRLDRLVGESVDLLVNGRVSARGDLVVVDGRLGLRVTEVLAPKG